MKEFLGFIRKEFYHIFRDIRTMIILFGIPITQIMIFGYAVTNEISNVKIVILDYAKDEVSCNLINRIEASEYFTIDAYIETPDQIEDYFKKGHVKEAIIFEKDLAKHLQKQGTANIQLILDAVDSNTATLIESYTSSIINSYMQEVGGIQPIIKINPEYRMLYNENMKGVFMFVPGTMALILIIISAMMTSISITREKELGTMEILLVSPLKPLQIIIGKVIPYFVLSFINAILIISLSHFIFDVPIEGSVLLLLGESMLFILMALSLGIMISTLAKNQQTAMMISIFALMLPTIMLSGFIFPIENMPIPLQYFSNIVPPKWYILIIKKIMLMGISFSYIWKETLILIFMCMFFVGMSVKRFKIRLE
jgi:ABC-2 type transport system permease protein